MKNKALKILNSHAYSLEKYGRKYIADYQFERVAEDIAEFVSECVEDILDARKALDNEDSLTCETCPYIDIAWEHVNCLKKDNVDWAGLDPVKWKDVKPSRKYIIFDDEKDSEINITP